MPRTQGPCRIANLLSELLQIVGQPGFSRIGEVTAAQPVRTALHTAVEIVLIHAIERAAQLRRSARLLGSQFTRCTADLLRKPPEIVGHLLAVADHFVDFLGRRIFGLLASVPRGIQLTHEFAHTIGLLLLPRLQLIRCLRHRIQAAGGVLLLRTAEEISGFTKAISGAASIGGTGALGGSTPHVFVRLAQSIERLLGGLLRGLRSGRAGRLAAALS